MMEELCAKSAENDDELILKMRRFIEDRSIETVTGIRRMGRLNTVMFLYDLASSMGKSCSVYPDTSGMDIILFEHWIGMEGPSSALICDNPDIDILFGQDLCHQVPAVVRLFHNRP